MPFEYRGVDLSTPDGQKAFAEVYTYFSETGSDNTGNYSPEVLIEFVNQFPDEAKGFLTFCRTHPEPSMRDYAVSLAIHAFQYAQPELTAEVCVEAMGDENEKVRKMAIGLVGDILAGRGWEDFVNKLSITSIQKVILAYKQSQTDATAT